MAAPTIKMVTISFWGSSLEFAPCSWAEFQKYLIPLNVSFSNHYCFYVSKEKIVRARIQNEESYNRCMNVAIGENIFFTFALKFETDPDDLGLKIESKEFVYSIDDRGVLMEKKNENLVCVPFGLTNQALVVWDYENCPFPGGCVVEEVYEKLISVVSGMVQCKKSDVHVEMSYDKSEKAYRGAVMLGEKKNLTHHSFCNRDNNRSKKKRKNRAEKILIRIMYKKLLRIEHYTNVVIISADQDLLGTCAILSKFDMRRKWILIHSQEKEIGIATIMRESPLWSMRYQFRDLLSIEKNSKSCRERRYERGGRRGTAAAGKV
ncbi:MAG: hypothetical protein Hyperionvirus4_89 [Hyperionvirus sp.]|uniref:NYN domain-containing protein n=1 Tax=Hyperionvirus sp. TaxID=2487770 RepID=A0A3G5A9G3_9VIRU|nr:MAG: hypothetical protein Hyperionvirus4_89 [Hyperionvirus sp.]